MAVPCWIYLEINTGYLSIYFSNCVLVCGAAEHTTTFRVDVVRRATGISTSFADRQVHRDEQNCFALSFLLLSLHHGTQHPLRSIDAKAFRQVLDSRLVLSLLLAYINLWFFHSLYEYPVKVLEFDALSVTSRDNCYHRDFSFPMLNSMNLIIKTVGLKFVGSGCIFIPRC